jgi:hypothetical protein
VKLPEEEGLISRIKDVCKTLFEVLTSNLCGEKRNMLGSEDWDLRVGNRQSPPSRGYSCK